MLLLPFALVNAGAVHSQTPCCKHLSRLQWMLRAEGIAAVPPGSAPGWRPATTAPRWCASRKRSNDNDGLRLCNCQR